VRCVGNHRVSDNQESSPSPAMDLHAIRGQRLLKPWRCRPRQIRNGRESLLTPPPTSSFTEGSEVPTCRPLPLQPNPADESVDFCSALSGGP
jgi:hypothetical protein